VDVPIQARPAERGIALVLVLVILPLVAIIMTQLSFETTIGERLADHLLTKQQFKQAIAARQAQMVQRLVRDLKDDVERAQQGGAYDHYGDLWGPDTEGGQTALMVRKGDAEGGDQVTLITQVVDEQGKFNLNLLRHSDQARRGRAFEVLRTLLDLFRDSRYDDIGDNEFDLNAGEANEVAEAIRRYLEGEERDERVRQVEIPAPAADMKQGVFAVDELVFSHRLFKEKRLLERFTDSESQQVLPSLVEFVTIYGDGKINVNTAPIQVLRSLWREEDGRRSVAEEMLRGRGGFTNTTEDQQAREDLRQERSEAREQGDEEALEESVTAYKSLNDLNQLEAFQDQTFLRREEVDIGRDFTVRSNFFTLVVTARRENFLRQHRLVLERHTAGVLTWDSEVRTADAAALPDEALVPDEESAAP